MFNVKCEMLNQQNRIVFSCEKSMMFQFAVPPSAIEVDTSVDEKSDSFLNHLISEAEVLSKLGSQTLSSVRPGQLILHSFARPITHAYTMQVPYLSYYTFI